MNEKLMRDELHRTLKRVIDQADEGTLRFLIKQCEMALSKLVLAKDEKQRPEVRRKLFEVKKGVPLIF